MVENGLESATEAEIDSAATSPTAPIPPVPRRGTARGIRAIEGHGFAIAPGFMVENDLPMAAQDDAEGPRLWQWSSPTLRVLPFDLPAARVLATYRVPERAPFDDALIAAVAQAAEMTVATRNTKHFEPLGVRCFNPWEPTV